MLRPDFLSASIFIAADYSVSAFSVSVMALLYFAACAAVLVVCGLAVSKQTSLGM